MANINLVAATLRKWVAYGPCTIGSIFGYNNQGANVYIQFHEIPPLANGTIANGAIPAFKSLTCIASLPFAFSPLGVTLKECLILLSSTEATYTAVGAGGGLDMTVVVSSDFLCDGTEVVVGDTTTARSTLQAWAEAGGPNQLLRLTVTDTTGLDSWGVIECTDADANTPIDQLFPIKANATVDLYFGPGYYPYTKDPAPNATVRQGCSVLLLNTGVVVAGVTYAPIFPWSQAINAGKIRAIYKP